MPSYRAVLSIGDVYPGHYPDEVLDAAVTAVSTSATVEHTDIRIVSNVPQIIVRFYLDDGDAQRIAEDMRNAVCAVASVGSGRLLMRRSGRWVSV